MKEVWKRIEGLKYHEVSNTGKVRSVGGIVIDKNGIIKRLPDKELRAFDNSLGYMRVSIKENGKEYREKYIHRLVAKAFIENPEGKPCVNHIDNDPSNNNVDNLEWCTKRENTAWMIKQGRNKRTEQWIHKLRESQKEYWVPVIATDPETGKTMMFESVNSTKAAGFSPGMVSSCINRKARQYRGLIWQRA